MTEEIIFDGQVDENLCNEGQTKRGFKVKNSDCNLTDYTSEDYLDHGSSRFNMENEDLVERQSLNEAFGESMTEIREVVIKSVSNLTANFSLMGIIGLATGACQQDSCIGERSEKAAETKNKYLANITNTSPTEDDDIRKSSFVPAQAAACDNQCASRLASGLRRRGIQKSEFNRGFDSSSEESEENDSTVDNIDSKIYALTNFDSIADSLSR